MVRHRHLRRVLCAVATACIIMVSLPPDGFSPFPCAASVSIPIRYQGLIKHPLTGKVLHRKTMERRLVLEVIELARIHDWHLVVYLGDEIFVKDFRQASSFYANLLGLEIQRVDDLARLVNESASECWFCECQDGEAMPSSRAHNRLGTEIASCASALLLGNPRRRLWGDCLRIWWRSR
jgi:hypothetical protein